MKMNVVDKITWLLLILGGLNWGLVGIKPSYDLVAKFFGGVDGTYAKVIYYLIGLSAVYSLYKMLTMVSEKSE